MLDRTEQLVEVKQEMKGFADQIEELRAEGEKLAEEEKSQWWRQPGSLWHDTQEFIDSADALFKAKADEEQRERRAEEEAKLRERVARESAQRASPPSA
jgi:hypothetical protein